MKYASARKALAMLEHLFAVAGVLAVTIFVVATLFPDRSSVYHVYRRATPRPVNDLDTLVQNAVNRLRTGSLTFNAPSEMRVGETRDMEAIVSRAVHDKITQALRGGGTATTMQVKVAPSMTAQLLASDQEFHITPLQPDAPVTFGPDGKIHWFWRIHPLKAGDNLEMQLVVQAIFDVKSGGGTRRINAITQDVVIRVNAKTLWERVMDFLKENWQWLWTAILVPFIPWVWARWRKDTQAPKP